MHIHAQQIEAGLGGASGGRRNSQGIFYRDAGGGEAHRGMKTRR